LEAEGTEYSGRGQKIPLTHLNKYHLYYTRYSFLLCHSLYH
jgi:hypothetical protein